MVNIYKAKPKASLLGKTLTFTIDNSDYEVQGISRQADKIAFISNALPGEQVQARVTEDKAGEQGREYPRYFGHTTVCRRAVHRWCFFLSRWFTK